MLMLLGEELGTNSGIQLRVDPAPVSIKHDTAEICEGYDWYFWHVIFWLRF
jgi:hypothetical protein